MINSQEIFLSFICGNPSYQFLKNNVPLEVIWYFINKKLKKKGRKQQKLKCSYCVYNQQTFYCIGKDLKNVFLYFNMNKGLVQKL